LRGGGAFQNVYLEAPDSNRSPLLLEEHDTEESDPSIVPALLSQYVLFDELKAGITSQHRAGQVGCDNRTPKTAAVVDEALRVHGDGDADDVGKLFRLLAHQTKHIERARRGQSMGQTLRYRALQGAEGFGSNQVPRDKHFEMLRHLANV
jgi:hypothetical protein